jgi:hypothetical protein
VNQATADRMITVGTKDQAMILTLRLLHQFFFMLTPRSSFGRYRRQPSPGEDDHKQATDLSRPFVEMLGQARARD